ncbi:hypothetical protein [Methylobacterium sp. JK268]
MPDAPTIGELFKLQRVTRKQLDAAVHGDLDDPSPGPRTIAEGVTLDPAAVMLSNPYARETLAREGAPQGQRRMAVRTAILLARPD